MLDLFKRVEKPTVVERFGPRGGYIYVGVFGPWILLVLPGLGIPAALHAHEQGNTPLAALLAVITAAGVVWALKFLRWIFLAARQATTSQRQARA